MGDDVSAQTGYKQLMEKNVPNCSIACDHSTAQCAETLTSSGIFALLFWSSAEEKWLFCHLLPVRLTVSIITHTGGWSPAPRGTFDPKARGCRRCAKPQAAQAEREGTAALTRRVKLLRVAKNQAIIPSLLRRCGPSQVEGCQKGCWDGVCASKAGDNYLLGSNWAGLLENNTYLSISPDDPLSLPNPPGLCRH